MLPEVPAPWTRDQWEAVTDRGSDLLVSAAAGAGKTAVLVERVVQLLREGVGIDRLLVVTFTDAAAAEMRSRISARLEKMRAEDPEDELAARQLALLGRASISTLHSFCLGVVRRYFYQLGLDPAFRVMDEGEAALLRQDVLAAVLERGFEQGPDGPFGRLADCLGGTGGRDLEQLVIGLYDYARSLPWPERWLAGLAPALDVPEGDIDGTAWARLLLAEARRLCAEARGWLDEARQLASAPGGPAAYLPALESDLELIAGMEAAAASWETLAGRLARGLAWARLGSARGVEQQLRDEARSCRDRARRALGRLAAGIWGRSGPELLEELRGLVPVMTELVRVVTDFHQAYAAAKADRAQVDFGDLEHFCLAVLAGDDGATPTAAALELQDRYAEVLIDEYQDINAVQDTILGLVCRRHEQACNRFMVGDVKQSIYRFRLADPGRFLDRYRRYPRTPGSRERRIDLVRNFRSDGTVLDAVNFVFRQLMNGGVGEVQYDEAAELVPGRSVPFEPGCPVELHLLERQPGAGAETDGEANGDEDRTADEPEDLEALEREAHFAGGLVRALVGGERPFRFFDPAASEVRPVSFRDIVILMRATRERANVVAEVFRSLELPVYAELGTGYFAATEVEVALALLAVVDNPRQDIPLATALRSPVVGLDAAELARVRLVERRADFYDAVRAAAGGRDVEPGLAAELFAFLSRLDQWRTAARRGPVSRLVWRVLEETGFYDYVGGMPGGTQRQANLRALYERARQFDGFARAGLSRFLRFVERLRETQDLGAAPALGEREDVVRVMSVHRSKGLEFPVVIVLDAGKQFNLSDLHRDVLYHRRLGLGPRVVDPERRIKYPSLAHAAVAAELRLEALAEEMRVLYVAMTRARELLLLVGSARDLAGQCRGWCRAARAAGPALPDAALARAQSWLDWLGPALARHEQGRSLADLAAVDPPPPLPSATSWRVYVHPHTGRQAPSGRAQADLGGLSWESVRRLEPPGPPADPALAAEVVRRLGWEYPHARLSERAAKVAVSELKRRFDPTREYAEDRSAHGARLPPRPRFVVGTGGVVTGAELGRGVHTVLEHLDLGGPLDPAGIAAQVAGMVERELLLPAVAEAVDVAQLAAFFRTPLGTRLVAARDSVRRELTFTLALHPARVHSGLEAAPPGEFVVVQGIVDCVFRDPAGLVLVDFKTDRAGAGTPLLPEYIQQLRVYAEAVSAALAQPVGEAYLVFLSTGTVVPVAAPLPAGS